MELNGILSVTALTLLLSSCSLIPGAWQESEIDHVVFQGIAEPLEVPENLASMGWGWEAPEETNVVAVHPASFGVVVTVSDGVVALRGDTGEELWRYRRVGEAVTDANVTTSGERVALAYPVDVEDEAAVATHDVVLLDSSTGKELGSHTEDFTAEAALPGNVTTLSPMPEHLGLLSDSSRIVYRKLDGQRTGVYSLDLETGDEMWSLTDLHGEGQEGRDFHPKGVVASGDTIILSGNFMDEDIESLPETSEKQEHTVVLLGLDADSGEELWRHELDRNAPLDLHPVRLGVQPTSGAVIAEARGVDEWILDPGTGERLTEEKFFSGREGNVIGALENTVVTEFSLVDDDEFEYSYTDFSGDTHTTIRASAPSERMSRAFVLPLKEAAVWLDVSQTNTSLDPEEAAWDEARLVIDEDGESRVIDLGVRVERDYAQDGSEAQRSSLPSPPDMTVAPGALVVQEKVPGGPRRLVGAVP